MADVDSSVHVSGSVNGNFHFSWEISRFSSLNFAVGERTESKSFQLQPSPPYWYVSLFPGGDSARDVGFVSCHLNRSEEDKNRQDCVHTGVNSFRFLNSVGKVLWNYSTENYSIDAGYSRIMKRDALIQQLVGDCLIITMNVTYCATSFMNGIDLENFSLWAPNAMLVQDFESLSTNSESADCVLSVGDDKFPVHSVILGARSKVFEVMFRNLMKDKESHSVEISDFKKDTMDSLVQFIYTGNVKVMDVEKALELLRASDKYEISDLNYYCSDYLSSQLNDENVAEILISADKYDAEELSFQATNYFEKNGWKELLMKHRSVLEKRGDLVYAIIDFMWDPDSMDS